MSKNKGLMYSKWPHRSLKRIKKRIFENMFTEPRNSRKSIQNITYVKGGPCFPIAHALRFGTPKQVYPPKLLYQTFVDPPKFLFKQIVYPWHLCPLFFTPQQIWPHNFWPPPPTFLSQKNVDPPEIVVQKNLYSPKFLLNPQKFYRLKKIFQCYRHYILYNCRAIKFLYYITRPPETNKQQNKFLIFFIF